MLKTAGKAIGFVFLLAAFALRSATEGIFLFRRSREMVRRARTQLMSRYAARVLKILGVRVEVSLENRLPRDRNFMIVSNHTGYIDALVIASVFPSAFVTSVEVQETPGLGFLAQLGGSLFVERRKALRKAEEVREIALPLFSGLNVVVFPEATSSNGERVLPFKAMTFDAAIRAQVKVLPLCLEYRRADGARLSPEERDSVYYYGEMKFLPHLFRLLKTDGIVARMKVLETLDPERAACRNSMRDRAFAKVSEAYDVAGTNPFLKPLAN